MKRLSVGLLTLVFCLLFLSCGMEEEAPLFSLYFLDAGQGDAILLRTEEGDILIDSGPEDAEAYLTYRLEALGVESLRLAVFTHPDEDHTGGGDRLLSQFPAEEVWINRNSSENESFQRLLETADSSGSRARTVIAGELFSSGGVTVSVLYPVTMPEAEDPNNSGSILLRVEAGSTVILLMGDAGVEEEMLLLSLYGRDVLKADLCKLGHHGSTSSSSERFLEAVDPDYAVITCGAGNPYGHPHGEVLARLGELGIPVLRTDLSGELVFVGDGNGIYPVWNDN